MPDTTDVVVDTGEAEIDLGSMADFAGAVMNSLETEVADGIAALMSDGLTSVGL